MTPRARLLSIGALSLCVMAASWNAQKPVVILVNPASGGDCEFTVGEDAGNAKGKHFRRRARKDEPIVWQILNKCGQTVDVNILDHEDSVTSYGGTNGFQIGTPDVPRSFPVRAGEGAFGIALIKESKKDESICVAVKGNKCAEGGPDVQISKPPAAAQADPGTIEIPGGGAAQATTTRNTRYKRAQVQIDIFQ